MFPVYKKEFNTFFAHPLGYGIIALFLIVNGLLLWVLRSDWNILNSGFADLQGFFNLTPWLFIILIPALLMRSFSEEYALGTIELLKTKPLKSYQVVLGKYLAVVTVVSISLVLTFIYVLSLKSLTAPNTIDYGSIIGSYLGLWLLAITFTAIAQWIVLLVKNQLLAFLVGIIVLFIVYYAGEQLGLRYNNFPEFIRRLGLYNHYKSISRGVLDLRDLVYFLSVTVVFLSLSVQRFKSL